MLHSYMWYTCPFKLYLLNVIHNERVLDQHVISDLASKLGVHLLTDKISSNLSTYVPEQVVDNKGGVFLVPGDTVWDWYLYKV